ncbi:MAG TPA: response regulator [Gemmatimonadales bacterium]|jgi:PAS domain S-box-containing protein
MPATIRILIVEDNPQDAALAEREVRRADIFCTFRRVDTREAMVAALRDFTPDVVLTDHSLPSFSARDALQVTQQLAPGTPVIIVTGRLGDESAVQYLQAGAADYIIKDHLNRLGPAVLRALDIKRSREAQARAHQLQAATYRIAEAAMSTPGLGELLPTIHQIVAELMPARNFYIALHDPAHDLLTFPYAVDEYDTDFSPRGRGKGLTDYVLRTGEPLLVTPEVQAALEQRGEVELIGAPSIDWLGVPLMLGDRAIGVLAVQTYTPGIRYGQREQDILQFVSTQVAMAIERSRAADDVRTSAARLKAIIDGALDAVITMDGEGVIRSWSPQAERLFEWPASDTIGRKLSATIIPARYRDAHERGLAHFLATGEGPVLNRRVEITGLRRDGREIPVELAITPMRLEGAWLFSAFVRDISERHLLESQLRQAQKMEAVGRLAGGIAHDFNNLLTAVLGSVDLVLDELGPEAPARGDVEEIRKAALRAGELTRQLLAFSRQQVLAPQVLDLNALVANMGKLLRRLIGEDVELRTALAPDLGAVKADPGQMEQVIANLVVNARDAMPAGGRLTVETANAELDKDYADQHFPAPPGSYVLLAVSDTGTGMDPETKGRIFEPFFTTKEKGKGTGLGLATVYGVVKQSGGYIWVYSEPGQGTAFKIYLPRVREAPGPARPGPAPAAPLRGSETLLLVEDDEMVRHLVSRMLKSRGYTVLAASDGTHALRQLESHRGAIDLLITDVVMPGMSGREVAQRVAALQPQAKVLYLSGYTDDAIVRHGMLEPGIAFLQKPFSADVLARKVREVLDAP